MAQLDNEFDEKTELTILEGFQQCKIQTINSNILTQT
jgi:hypothetical protein